MAGRPLLEVRDLRMWFPIRRGVFRGVAGHVRAVDGVTFGVSRGETLGVVGESGCGKSTLLRCLLRLHEPTGGEVLFDGLDVLGLRRKELRALRRRLQVVFQDPYSSLDPRMSVSSIVEEPLVVHRQGSRTERAERVTELMRLVGLSPESVNRYPHEFSGGQRQRIGIARSLALHPELVLLDEPVSALDVSIQAQVLNLLTEIQARLGLAYVFVAHDLSVVRHVSDRVLVMYCGKVMEVADTETLVTRPAHPYTQALLSSVPVPDPRAERSRAARRVILAGDVPSAAHPPSGCVFRTRCPKAAPLCEAEVPALADRGTGRPVACHFAEVGAGVPTDDGTSGLSGA